MIKESIHGNHPLAFSRYEERREKVVHIMNKYPAFICFLAGVGAVALFFDGAVLPIYG